MSNLLFFVYECIIRLFENIRTKARKLRYIFCSAIREGSVAKRDVLVAYEPATRPQRRNVLSLLLLFTNMNILYVFVIRS